MQLFYSPNIAVEHALPLDEAKHCFHVLRKKTSDIIDVIDGKGCFYSCLIVSDHPKQNKLKILSKKKEESRERYLHLIVSPTKNMDRNEWMIEKAVEIGVSEISFMLTSNSERRLLKLDRILKKAISAMKQSIKATLPKINEMTSFDELLLKVETEKKWIAHLDDKVQTLSYNHIYNSKSASILIGSEGGFTKEEVQKSIEAQFQPVSLGNSRLRTETAAIFSLSLLNQ